MWQAGVCLQERCSPWLATNGTNKEGWQYCKVEASRAAGLDAGPAQLLESVLLC